MLAQAITWEMMCSLVCMFNFPFRKKKYPDIKFTCIHCTCTMCMYAPVLCKSGEGTCRNIYMYTCTSQSYTCTLQEILCMFSKTIHVNFHFYFIFVINVTLISRSKLMNSSN